ncbi:hypothetical protein J2W42_002244 [Rhizobium tibeticum]|uniref:hypothetical protein n=1 Tax=Rhizobium tibeticum TaxID=501024 RepID=UPI0027830D00|nr:hypothetical protein [Rhizobium tibeticum]MDP9809396.1 hypothetical protein [Rhizobium tibeticum]
MNILTAAIPRPVQSRSQQPRDFMVCVLHSDGSTSYATGNGKLGDELSSDGDDALVFWDMEEAKGCYALLSMLGYHASIEPIWRASR